LLISTSTALSNVNVGKQLEVFCEPKARNKPIVRAQSALDRHGHEAEQQISIPTTIFPLEYGEVFVIN